MDNRLGWKREFSSKPAPTLRATIYFRMKAMIRSYCKWTSLDQIKRMAMVKIRIPTPVVALPWKTHSLSQAGSTVQDKSSLLPPTYRTTSSQTSWRGHSGILCGCGLLNVNYVNKWVKGIITAGTDLIQHWLSSFLHHVCWSSPSSWKLKALPHWGHHCLCQMSYRRKAENIQLLRKSIYRWVIEMNYPRWV